MDGIGSLIWIAIIIISVIVRIVSKTKSSNYSNTVNSQIEENFYNFSDIEKPEENKPVSHFSVAQLPKNYLEEAVEDYIKKHVMLVRYCSERMSSPDTIDEYFESYESLTDSLFILETIEKQKSFDNVSYAKQQDELMQNFGENTIQIMDAFWESSKNDAKSVSTLASKEEKLDAYFAAFEKYRTYMTVPAMEHFEAIRKEYKENRDSYLYY